MKYKKIVEATFLSRPNRFLARVLLNGREEIVHVKNTGRCRELFIPGCKVFLSDSENKARKTRYDLVAIEKQREGKKNLLVNLDSQAPNACAEEWLKKGNLFSKNAKIRREVPFASSRFDFYVEEAEKRAFIEVKGVTLEEGGAARFPDAPTIRGVKHVDELILAKKEGYEAYILFVIQMKEIASFSPNDVTHPAFGAALRKAEREGVQILAMDCLVEPNELVIDSPVSITL